MNINVTVEWIYEDHTVTRWDAELNVEEIIATIDATVAVAKRKPEKNSGADHSLGNRLNAQLPVVLLAPLVEYWTGIVEVKGSNPEQAWIFSGVVFPTAKVVHIIDECYKHGNSPISVSARFHHHLFHTSLLHGLGIPSLKSAFISCCPKK